MEDLLTVSSTKRVSRPEEEEHLSLAHHTEALKVAEPAPNVELKSSGDVLSALQNSPSFEVLRSCLRWLATPQEKFDIRVPGSQAAQIISALVNETIPNYWPLLNENLKERKLLLKSLTSVASLGAIYLRLRTLLNNSRSESTTKVLKAENARQVQDCLEVLQQILKGRSTLQILWKNIQELVEKPIQRHMLWNELLGFVASSRILSLAAEGLIYCDSSSTEDYEPGWVGDGRLYASWLGTNANNLASNTDDFEARKASATILGRALSLGYIGQVIKDSYMHQG